MLALVLTATLLASPAPPLEAVLDTLPADAPPPVELAPSLANLYPDRFPVATLTDSLSDTVRARPRAVEYSGAYYARLKVHRYTSYAMLPLFAAQYAAGQALYSKGREDAPGWAKDLHAPLASAIAGLWVVNTVTGAWNWWDSRHVKEGRTLRTVHGLMMTLAGAGFVAVGATAPERERGGVTEGSPTTHRNLAIGSMGLATASWLIMLVAK